MPCRSEHMEPNEREEESRIVARLMSYCLSSMGLETPANVIEAAENYYGDADKCDDFTVMLCALIREMDDETREAIVYNAHDKMSRALADWWERHQKWDKEDGRA